MNNKNIQKEIQKNNNIKLNRNGSLDSTNSSFKVKKVKLYSELTPFFKITQNYSMKGNLDFPIFMSLFTNNYSQNEKEIKLKLNSSNKGNLKFQGLKDIKIKNYNHSELLLPQTTKRKISRNANGVLNSLSPSYSNIKSSFLTANYCKLPLKSSRIISKPLLKKINYSQLNKFSQENIGKPLMNYRYYKKTNSLSNITLESEMSIAKDMKKNSSSGNLKLIDNNLILNEKKKNLLVNRFKNEKRYKILNKNINLLNKILKQDNIIDEECKNNNNEESTGVKNDLSKFSEKNENIDKKNNNLRNKEKLDELDKIKNSKIKKINFTKEKNVKINASMSKLIDAKELLKKNNFKRSINKKEILSLSQAHENKIKINNEIYPQKLMAESQKITKIKKNKFYLAINNKKSLDIYSKNKFLNKIYKKLNDKSINNRINTQIFLKKTEILINSKENIERYIFKERNKAKKNNSIKISKNDKNNMKSIYFKDICMNKNKINEYNGIILFFYEKKINYIFKCKLCPLLTKAITGKTQFDVLTVTKPKKKRVLQKRFTLEEQPQSNNYIKNIIRVYSFTQKKTSFNNNLNDGFQIRKTENVVKAELYRNKKNLILIHGYILKSLPYYFDFSLEKKNKNNQNQTRGINSYKSTNRKISRRMGIFNNLGLSKNSSQILNTIIKKKTIVSRKSENESLFSPQKLIRRSSQQMKIDDFNRTLRKKLSQKNLDPNYENLSILKQKKFFKKEKICDDINDQKTGRKEIDENSNFKNNDKGKNDEINVENIYLELIKLIIEGKNKMFKNYYEKNRAFIDINEELFEGNTLLILSAREGNYHITKFLCEEGAEVNLQNHNGNTALHYAIGRQFYALADILTRHGAREDIKNNKGFGPWDCIDHNIE